MVVAVDSVEAEEVVVVAADSVEAEVVEEEEVGVNISA